jgi:hypothetical protein
MFLREHDDFARRKALFENRLTKLRAVGQLGVE